MSKTKPDNAAKPTQRSKGQRRRQRPFPAGPFEDAEKFASQIFEYGSGEPVRRLSLFDSIGKSPESGTSRQAIVNAGKYGLITGGVQAENLSLSEVGRIIVDNEKSPRERARARVQLAIMEIEPFKSLYERFEDKKHPARAALIDAVKESGVPEELSEEAVDTFIVNLSYVGLLKTLSGAERIISVDHLLDTLPANPKKLLPQPNSDEFAGSRGQLTTTEHAAFDRTCFFVAPIGEEGSEQRRHSDLFLGSLVEPALEQFGLSVVRADTIEKPGTITKQVIEYLVKSRLVIADLSFHNPNVFYELAIRHATRQPVVQITRAADPIPFDINQVRTVQIDTSDIYSIVPQIDSYRAQIASQIRAALDDPDIVDNPLSTHFPNLKMESH